MHASYTIPTPIKQKAGSKKVIHVGMKAPLSFNCPTFLNYCGMLMIKNKFFVYTDLCTNNNIICLFVCCS